MLAATILIRPAAPSTPLHYETRCGAGASKCRPGVLPSQTTACLDLIGTNVSLISMLPSRHLAAPLLTCRGEPEWQQGNDPSLCLFGFPPVPTKTYAQRAPLGYHPTASIAQRISGLHWHPIGVGRAGRLGPRRMTVLEGREWRQRIRVF